MPAEEDLLPSSEEALEALEAGLEIEGVAVDFRTVAKPGAGARAETETYRAGQRGVSFEDVEGEHRGELPRRGAAARGSS
jgi:hypothetical protein